MSAFYRTMRLLILALTFVTPVITLSSCMGGPIAQQIVSSIMMRGADKIINNAYEAQEREAERHTALKDTPPDPYRYAFITSGFKTIAPTVEALPASASAIDGTALITSKDGTASPTNTNLASAQVTRLVHVEIWNLIIGDEKNLLLEKARLLGAEVPPKDEWRRWKVATGALVADKNKPITFLIPPEFGRVGSGDRAVVEMTELSQIHVARYAVN
jgi:hypothetical protein